MGMLTGALTEQRKTETLNPLHFHLMMAIAHAPQDSYSIVQNINARTEGAVQIGIQTVYSVLNELRKKSWVEQSNSLNHADTAQRKIYSLSSLGQRVLKIEIQRLESIVNSAYQMGMMD